MSRPVALLVLALTAGLVLLGMPSFSGATYVATTRNATSTVTAARDWTPPTVSVRSPGVSVKDTVTVTADAADGETGIAQVVVQYSPEGSGTWTTLCTATTAPYSCPWNTKNVADGAYELRARATDGAGYTTVSEAVRTTVANNLLVTLSRPADVVRGTVPLTLSLFGTGTLTYTVRVEYAVAGTGTWRSAQTTCTGTSSPYSCSWSTGGLANDFYDLRAVATNGSNVTYSAVVADVEVDNTAPTVTMTDPGSPLRGTATFAATATDVDSGVATVVVQYAVTGTSTWKDLCTIGAEPFSCRYDTVALADGSYGFRAVATDAAGNVTTSAAVANRLVDNTVSSVSVNDPGTYLNGTVALSAAANSSAGVTSVTIQRAPAGSSTWTDVCTDATAPYTCSWNTTTVADGTYSLRAVLVDGTGKQTVSAVSPGHVVDNSPLRGFDVQTVGAATLGRIGSGDAMRLTYSDQVTLGTISSGWDGSALAAVVRVRDGNLLGLGNKGDTLDVLRPGGGVVNVPLGSVRLNEDYLKTNKTAQFNATLTATTVTVNGSPATQVTVTLGTQSSGAANVMRTVTLGSTMQWTPSATVTDLTGRACSVAPAAETGAADREF